jgi:DNA-binding transcriptional regulator YhcF (GntR family)
MNASDAFKTWLDKSVGTLPAGSQLPIDRELSAVWKISHSTVRRIMEKYAREGRITRVKGKGTFTGQLSLPQEPVAEVQVSAQQSIFDEIMGLIAKGELKRGDPLPSYKSLCMNFRVSPVTVSAVYNKLRQTGLVVRVGKYFWVGDFLTIARTDPRKEVLFLYAPSTELAGLFSTHEMALSLNKMEKENRIRVPQQVSIIGLENDRRYLHLGITTCMRDWETMGYLMAHAVIGDIPMRTTRRGFIDYDALLLERRTTPR